MDATSAARWALPFGVLVVGGAVLISADPALPVGAVAVAVLLVAAWWLSPLRRATSTVTHREAATRAAESDAVVVYWRPGCQFCAAMRLLLGRARGKALWVNIWADADAAAFVRGVNGGNETVPTVVVGRSEVWTNPAPRAVRAAIAARG